MNWVDIVEKELIKDMKDEKCPSEYGFPTNCDNGCAECWREALVEWISFLVGGCND